MKNYLVPCNSQPIFFWQPLCRVTASMTVVLICALSASAQLTVQALIGDSVDEIGPQHAGVGEAISLFQAGEVNDARERLKEACESAPELAPADVLLAKMLLAANNAGAAAGALDRAITEASKDPEAYIMYGDLLFRQTQIAPAELMFLKAAEACSAYSANEKRKQRLLPRISAGLAAVAEARRDWAAAQEHLENWKQLDPQNPNACGRLARVLYRMGQYQESLDEFGNLLKSEKTAGLPEVNLGLLYEADGKRTEAQAMMQTGASKGADHLQTRLVIARWAFDANLVETAKENATAALKLDPNSLQAQLLVGLVARWEKDFTAAEKTFVAAHLAAPSNFAASNNLALTLAEQDDERKQLKGLTYATVNVRAYSDVKTVFGREAAVTYGWVLFRLGRETLAEKALENVPVPIPTKESAYYAAQVFHDRGRPEVVIRLLRPALEDGKHFLYREQAQQLLKKATKQFLDRQSGIR